MSERELFEAALEIADQAQRKAFLDQACAGNQEQRAAIDTLLKAHEEAGSFLNVPAIAAWKEGADAPAERTVDFVTAKKGMENDDELELGFLEPSDKPESIGRLAHYEVLKVLGKGGFGTVLQAFDEKLHRMVAIKVMDPQMAATSPPRKRFLREARAAAAIRHENIVQVYSVEEKPLPYLVMEYIDGQTLQQKQLGQGPLEVAEVLHIGRQIASGLAAAHATGLIHRDIKPANVLLQKGLEQKVKITDFGLARAADDASLSVSGQIAGTPMYMAPEQATGQTLDHRVDLFSLGSVLYQLTSGRPPFRASTTVAVLRRVVEDTPRPIHEIIPETPDWLVAIISKLHSKNPSDRYQTAEELSELLALCQAELAQGSKAKLPAELLETITLYKEKIRANKPSGWVASTRNIGAFVGTLLLFVILSAGVVWWGTELTGYSRLVMHGILAAAAVVVSLSCWIAESYFTRKGKHELAQVFTSIIGSASLLAAGNAFMARTDKPAAAPQAVAAQKESIRPAVVAQEITEPLQQQLSNKLVNSPVAAVAPFTAQQAKEHQQAWADYLKVPVEYTNSLGMKFRLIPPGEFVMGSTEKERSDALLGVHPDDKMRKAYIESEFPQHPVVITKPYYVGIHEVTQKQYATIIGKNPSIYQPSNPDKKIADKVTSIDADNLPVDNVSWTAAFELAVKLNERTSKERGYRLLTEAEWEFACRAGTTENYWTGADHGGLSNGAWITVNSEARPHPVGLRLANPFGLYDTHGNVWEWVQDAWDPQFYRATSGKPAIDPCCVSGKDDLYVQRGGDWTYIETHSRSAARGADHSSAHQFYSGVRLGLSVEGVQEAIKK